MKIRLYPLNKLKDKVFNIRNNSIKKQREIGWERLSKIGIIW